MTENITPDEVRKIRVANGNNGRNGSRKRSYLIVVLLALLGVFIVVATYMNVRAEKNRKEQLLRVQFVLDSLTFERFFVAMDIVLGDDEKRRIKESPKLLELRTKRDSAVAALRKLLEE